MFTGLISDVGEVIHVEVLGTLRKIRIACHYDVRSLVLGASVACAGPCLTIVGSGDFGARSFFDVEAAHETATKTNVAHWQAGTKLNLERSLKLGDEMGGHIVTGHIDGLATIVERIDFDGTARFDVRAPKDLARFIAQKGSVCLDGTSLTVNSIERDCFSVLLIPHTLSVTTWGATRRGDQINLEVDLMARYAARLIEAEATPIETAIV